MMLHFCCLGWDNYHILMLHLVLIFKIKDQNFLEHFKTYIKYNNNILGSLTVVSTQTWYQKKANLDFPMQRIRVWSLIHKDSTCCRATKPVCLGSHTTAAEARASCSITIEATTRSLHPTKNGSFCLPQLEKVHGKQQWLNAAKHK